MVKNYDEFTKLNESTNIKQVYDRVGEFYKLIPQQQEKALDIILGIPHDKFFDEILNIFDIKPTAKYKSWIHAKIDTINMSLFLNKPYFEIEFREVYQYVTGNITLRFPVKYVGDTKLTDINKEYEKIYSNFKLIPNVEIIFDEMFLDNYKFKDMKDELEKKLNTYIGGLK